jgi:hypothetical protein
MLARMETEIVLPEIVPAMTLPEMAFFPQALLPLHVFEARYRQMLRDVLASDRLFAVAGLDFQRAGRHFEPPYRIAGVGMVRACQKNDNGTSKELTLFLNTVDDPATFVDIAAFNLCQDTSLKQRLLSTLNVHRRFELFSRQLRSDIDEIKFRRKLQGGLPDDKIARN